MEHASNGNLFHACNIELIIWQALVHLGLQGRYLPHHVRALIVSEPSFYVYAGVLWKSS